MIEYLIAWLIFILCGALIGALIREEVAWILFCSIGAAIASGIVLAIIWAIISVSQYFGIPLIIAIAIVIVAWFILGKR